MASMGSINTDNMVNIFYIQSVTQYRVNIFYTQGVTQYMVNLFYTQGVTQFMIYGKYIFIQDFTQYMSV